MHTVDPLNYKHIRIWDGGGGDSALNRKVVPRLLVILLNYETESITLRVDDYAACACDLVQTLWIDYIITIYNVQIVLLSTCSNNLISYYIKALTANFV